MNNQPKYHAKALDLIHELLSIAMATPKTVADVHINYSAHVDLIHVQVYAHGWHKGADPSFDKVRYLDRTDSDFAHLRKIHEDLVAHLESLRGKTEFDRRAERIATLRANAAKLLAEADTLAGNPAPAN